MAVANADRRALAAPRPRVFARADAAVVAAAVACLALVALASPGAVVQDTWLTLVAGRAVATDGIPHHELLTVWARGRSWTDQQWLAQLAFFRTYALGGMRAVTAVSAALTGAAWLGALVLARRRGASGGVLLVWAPATLLVAPWALQARAQSFALPLFVGLLALLSADGRRRSWRVFGALPLLALWGNVHGTAVLGACLLAAHAFAAAGRDLAARAPLRPTAARTAALAGGGFLALAANPYGFGILSYYRTMLVDPPFASLVVEWAPSTPSPTTAPFYALALAAALLAIRNRRRLAASEALLGLILLAAAFDAVRSIVWFALASLAIVPPLVRAPALPPRLAAPARAALLLGTLVSLAGALVQFPASVAAHQARDWPPAGVAAVRAAVARNRHVRVLANDRHADFLLFAAPELGGRLLADARLELLTRRQLRRLARFERDPASAAWTTAPLVVLDPRKQPLARWRTSGWRPLYADRSIAVVARTAR